MAQYSQNTKHSIKQQYTQKNGFASRFLYVYPKEVKKQKYSERTPDKTIVDRYEKLITHFYYLSRVENPFTLSTESKELFIQYANQTTDMVNSCSNNFVRATYAKMEIQVLQTCLAKYSKWKKDMWIGQKSNRHRLNKWGWRITLLIKPKIQKANLVSQQVF